MFDRQLLKLIGGNKKYVVYTVLLMVLGMLANIGITASVCWAVYFLIEGYEPLAYIYPAITAVIAIIVRYVASRCTGSLKDMLGRKVKKDLRERTYDKILRLGVRSTDGMSMAGLTQVSMEGIEQLDLYYSTYLPQFFFSMLAPIILFCICVGIDWRTSLVLLACVPLIPVSIVAVSKYAKSLGGRRFCRGALHAQPLRRALFGRCTLYVDCRRPNDTQPFSGTYAACDNARYAHLHVLCSHAQRGDRAGARGDENTRRRQRSQP